MVVWLIEDCNLIITVITLIATCAGCHTTELLLSCPPGQLLVVHSAIFRHAGAGVTLNCSARTQHSARITPELGLDTGTRVSSGSGDRDIRRAVTRRCSGYSRGEDCKFSLLLDVAESEVWGGGLVTVVHTCVSSNQIRNNCHANNQVYFNSFSENIQIFSS